MSNESTPQYYYKKDGCPAKTAHDADCICWHDEGTGPFPDERPDDPDTLKEWRFKPTNAAVTGSEAVPVDGTVMRKGDWQMKIADQILGDDGFDSYDGKIDAIIDLARELEDIASQSLQAFRCTQRPEDYPQTHWSNRLETLLRHNAELRPLDAASSRPVAP